MSSVPADGRTFPLALLPQYRAPMPCPVCRGGQRRLIAPQYWECTTLVSDPGAITKTWVPAGAGGQMVPMVQQSLAVQRPCGHRYQEGASVNASSKCECGTYAIGTCKQCGLDVCGDHSLLIESVRLCAACAKRRRADLAKIEAERRQVLVRRAEDASVARTAALEAIIDPIERLVTTMTLLKETGGEGSMWGITHPSQLVGSWHREVRALCPSLVDEGGSVSWDSAQVAAWFVRRAVDQGLASTQFVPYISQKRLFSSPRSVPIAAVKAWEFPHAVVREYRGERKVAASLFVLLDGRMMTPSRKDIMGNEQPSLRLSNLPPVILKQMGARLGLHPRVAGV